jgi:glycosyltransferase involved in cell wall biosynthesis
VEEGRTGYLVEPKNVDALVEGFHKFTEENYASLSQNAYEAFEAFNSLPQTKKFLEKIDTL